MLYQSFLVFLLQFCCLFGRGKGFRTFPRQFRNRLAQQPVILRDTPASPSSCSHIFQYEYNSGAPSGFLSITPPAGRVTQLRVDVTLALPATLPTKYVGKLDLADRNDVVAQKITTGTPISYRVHFPLSSPLPQVTLVTVNGNHICSATFDQRQARSTTTIRLNNIFYPAKTLTNSGSQHPGVLTNSLPSNFNEMPSTFVQPLPVDQRPNDKNTFFRQTNVQTTTFRPPVGQFNPAPGSFNSGSLRPTALPVNNPVVNFPTTVIFPSGPSQAQHGITCGRPVSSNLLIVNGDPVNKRGDWPWLAAVFQKLDQSVGLKFCCGGTLISRNYVLTAAHCSRIGGKESPPEKFTLYLGKFNLDKWSEPGSQIRDVKNIHISPTYDSNADSDIAVMELSLPAEYSPYIQPACMWPSSSSDLSPIVGRIGTVVGWGVDENNKISSTEPKMARMPIVSQEECLRSESSFTYLTSTRTFCAGNRNGTGPCNGDSGGGFMLPTVDEERGGYRWYIRGVVSRSLQTNGIVKCDQENYVIFTDTAKHGAWLSQFVR